VAEPPLLTPIPADAPKRRAPRWIGWVALLVIIVIAIVVVAVQKQHQKQARGHAITYLITGEPGDTANNISYLTAGGEQQASSATLPWMYSAQLRALRSGAAVVVEAQRSEGDAGSITCEIDVDDKTAARNTSTGPYAVVSCTSPLS
jgi:hypothetical protein